MRLFRTLAATTVAFSAALLGGSQALAVEAPQAAAQPARVAAPGADFTGIAALSNCSASLVRYAESLSTDKALVLTNGHCYEGGMPSPGQVIVNRASTRSITLLRPSSSNAGTVRAGRVLYSTMTKTDITLYEVKETYASIKTRLNVSPLTLAKQAPANGAGTAVVRAPRTASRPGGSTPA